MAGRLIPEELDKVAAGHSDEEFRRLAWYGKNNLYFFTKTVLGYNRLVPHVHRAPCEFMEVDVEGEVDYRGVLMPRSHYKTVINQSDCIRRLCKDPEERILLVNEVATNAQAMLLEIRRQFENNELLRALYPEVIPPDFSKTTWSSEHILIPRRSNWKEPSITAMGTGGAAVSKHFTTIKGDDIIGMSSLESPTVMEAAKRWLKYAVSLLISAKEGRIQLWGTRWHKNDVYAFAAEQMGFKFLVRKAIVMGPDGPQPLFPEQFTLKFFQAIIEGDLEQWASQYANDPHDIAEMDFKKSWLRYYRYRPDGDIQYTDDLGRLSLVERSKLRVYVHVDPSMGESPLSDHSAIVVVGIDETGRIFVLETWKARLDPIKLIDAIFDVYERWQPKLVSIEGVAFQKSLKYYIEKEARHRGTYLRIETPKAHPRKSKNAYIRGALQPYWSAGLIYINTAQTELLEEYGKFGGDYHPDLLDAFAQGPEYWKTPKSSRRIEHGEKLLAKIVAEQSRGITGYGI